MDIQIKVQVYGGTLLQTNDKRVLKGRLQKAKFLLCSETEESKI